MDIISMDNYWKSGFGHSSGTKISLPTAIWSFCLVDRMQMHFFKQLLLIIKCRSSCASFWAISNFCIFYFSVSPEKELTINPTESDDE